ncbi:hypothetical protein EYZ11_007707 [Aspergillus tanneri]|uniref:Uncharacterized protein n=1 Tax=Aspergillus tanneri TaxID=1220188 RepID=A0A4S3JCN5_9EURO|nr:hypothetical protein EYZ11_007707 [Aspergillus tanneri]
MECAIFQRQTDDTKADPIHHEQLEAEKFDKEFSIVLHELAQLTAYSKLELDSPIFGARERHTIAFELINCLGSFTRHIMNGILVSEPIGSLDSVMHVPSIVILSHIPQGGVDPALCGDCM